MIKFWAYGLALVVLCLPICSPDLFWHLNTGRWILRHFQLPTTDPFSFTEFGKTWTNFEWGFQILVYGIERFFGMLGLWVFKFILLAGVFWSADGLLRDNNSSVNSRIAGLLLLLAALLPMADLRADLISAIFFAVILRRLECRRHSFVFGYFSFCLWANLHAGFPIGFVLYLIYGLIDYANHRRVEKDLAAEAVGAFFGSLMNPYGLGIYSVHLAHMYSAPMMNFVMEWSHPNWRITFQRPLIVLLSITPFLLWKTKNKFQTGLWLVTLSLGLLTTNSARFSSYYAIALATLLFKSFPRVVPRLNLLILLLLSILLIRPIAIAGYGTLFNDRYVARRAIEFIYREQNNLSPLRSFNVYEWGGYLAWRLDEPKRIFGDGRYLFHHQLAQLQEALSSPEKMAIFKEKYQLDAFLLRNDPTKLAMTRLYPDGSVKQFMRPWYISYFPKQNWALVYWDEQALFFVDRSKVESQWLNRYEYRLNLPGDEIAREDALSRGEISQDQLDKEISRHQQ